MKLVSFETLLSILINQLEDKQQCLKLLNNVRMLNLKSINIDSLNYEQSGIM